KDEAHQGLYVVVEIGHSTIASKLLGDDVSHHQIADNHYVGAWIHLSYKTGWRTSPATVPGGKALLGGSALEDEQVTDDLIEAIEALEVPLPPPQLVSDEGLTSDLHPATGSQHPDGSSSSSGAGGSLLHHQGPTLVGQVPIGGHLPPHQGPVPVGQVPIGGHLPPHQGPVPVGQVPIGGSLPLHQGSIPGGQVPVGGSLPPHLGPISAGHVPISSALPGSPAVCSVPSSHGWPHLGASTYDGAPQAQYTHGVTMPAQPNPMVPVNYFDRSHLRPLSLPTCPYPSSGLPGPVEGLTEVPKFVISQAANDMVDGVVRHRAKQEAKDSPLPDNRPFSGVDDPRPVVNIIKSANRLSSTNGWTAIEYYFYLSRCLDESVAQEINPVPQQTHSAYGQEVLRMCQQLCHLYQTSETEYIRSLFAWNSLTMTDKQSLAEYLKAFDNLRAEIERQQRYSFDDRFLSSKLVMSLRGHHHEMALSRMKTLSYRQLLYELIDLDRLRNLSAQQRSKSNALASDSSRASRGTEALPKLPVNAVSATAASTVPVTSGPPPPPHGQGSSPQVTNVDSKASAARKSKRRFKRTIKCPRCLDREPRCSGDVNSCPAPMPVEKDGRCPHCNRPTPKCSPPCPKSDLLCTRGCGGKHHPAHCKKAPATSTEADTLAFQALDFKDRSPSSSCPCRLVDDTSVALNFTKVPLSSMPSPLRNAEFSFATTDGRGASFEGLMDTGGMLRACSEVGLNKLRLANVHLSPTGQSCTATLAVNKKVSSCPIYEITYIHRSQKVDTYIAMVRGLNRDFIWSAEVFRRLSQPILWVFNNAGDKLISLVDATAQVTTAFSQLLSAVDSPQSSSPPTTTAACAFEVSHQEDNPLCDDPELEKDLISLPFSIDDLPYDAGDDIPQECCNLAFSGEPPVISLASLSASSSRSPTKSSTAKPSLTVTQPTKAVYDPSHPRRFSYRLRWLCSRRPQNDSTPFIKRATSLAHQLRRKGHFDLYNDQLKAFEKSGY
ncbi:hypothetical protein FOZ63_031735, partial [Perkinsus olseni]